jgi:nitrite reductase/ring-hydroxylating ferredoxin subunit
MRLVTVAGVELGIFEVNGALMAYRNVCPHAGAPVCTGKITGTTLPGEVYAYRWGRIVEILRCPWHGWEFDLMSGEHVADNRNRLRQYSLTTIDDDIYVDL